MLGSHPYYPRDLKLPGYQPATLGFVEILSGFALSAAILIATVWIASGRLQNVTATDRRWMCWFAFTGATHFIVEGTVVIDGKFYQDRTGNFLREIWKEYAKADSRYASRESFTICMEFATAFIEGPCCFMILYGIAKRRSWRHVLQLMVSLGQLYGDILYFMTFFYEGMIHSRPEALYFWIYFVFVNAIWILVPGWNIWTVARCLNSAVSAHDRQQGPEVQQRPKVT